MCVSMIQSLKLNNNIYNNKELIYNNYCLTTVPARRGNTVNRSINH